MERSRRQLAVSAKSVALAQFAELKKSGQKRSDQYAVRWLALAGEGPSLRCTRESRCVPVPSAAHRCLCAAL